MGVNAYSRHETTVRSGGYTGKPSQNSGNTAEKILSQVFADLSNTAKCYAAAPGTAGGGGGRVDASEERRAGSTQEKEIKDALKNAGIDFDSLDDEIKTDVLKKYDAYTNVLRLADDVKANRIVNYVKALQAHQIEHAMGEFDEKVFTEALNEVAQDPEHPTTEELELAKKRALEKRQSCDLKIDDTNIETQRATGTDAEYFGALKGRGEGYVDMYDTDNDGKVSFDEFKAFETKDAESALDSAQEMAVQQMFNRIDRDGDGIDANEMASHLYAVSRLHDTGNGPNTVSDITLGEWHDSQKILYDADVSARYDNISSQLYDVLRED